MQAVMKQATLAVIMALKTTAAKSLDREGAIAANAPNMIPIEMKLAYPQRPQVEITSDRKSKKSNWHRRRR